MDRAQVFLTQTLRQPLALTVLLGNKVQAASIPSFMTD
jgi:hypothetical protein